MRDKLVKKNSQKTKSPFIISLMYYFMGTLFLLFIITLIYSRIGDIGKFISILILLCIACGISFFVGYKKKKW